MERSVIFSGFGGQGALFAGQILAYAAMESGLEVTWYPSYGPEMRGGTAHCTVVVGEEPIGSPMVHRPDAVIAMNLPSADKYEPLVKPRGLIIWDSALVLRPARRADVRLIAMPANAMATRIRDVRLVNMIMLGALCRAWAGEKGFVSLEAAENALRAHLPERYAHLLEPNFTALREGAAFAAEAHSLA